MSQTASQDFAPERRIGRLNLTLTRAALSRLSRLTRFGKCTADFSVGVCAGDETCSAVWDTPAPYPLPYSRPLTTPRKHKNPRPHVRQNTRPHVRQNTRPHVRQKPTTPCTPKTHGRTQFAPTLKSITNNSKIHGRPRAVVPTIKIFNNIKTAMYVGANCVRPQNTNILQGDKICTKHTNSPAPFRNENSRF